MRIVTYSWRFYKYKITGQCKCSECGKKINKTFSFEYREDTIPNPEYIEKLKKEKQEWEQESHICNSCLKKKIKQESKDITNNFTEDFSKIQEYHKERIEFANKMQNLELPIFQKLNEQLKGKVLLASDREWVIDSVCDGWNGESFQLNCTGIDMKQPWTKYDKYLYVGDKDKFVTQGNSCWIDIKQCKITDEIFSKRKDLL